MFGFGKKSKFRKRFTKRTTLRGKTMLWDTQDMLWIAAEDLYDVYGVFDSDWYAPIEFTGERLESPIDIDVDSETSHMRPEPAFEQHVPLNTSYTPEIVIDELPEPTFERTYTPPAEPERSYTPAEPERSYETSSSSSSSSDYSSSSDSGSSDCSGD